MQRQPHGARLVLGQLDEVIAAAERAERQASSSCRYWSGVARVSAASFSSASTRAAAVVVSLRVVPAGAHRNPAFDAGTDRAVGDVRTGERRANRNHPAADVHADRGGNDGAFGGSTVPTVAPLP